jgi:hypothetical protein
MHRARHASNLITIQQVQVNNRLSTTSFDPSEFKFRPEEERLALDPSKVFVASMDMKIPQATNM